jgi:3-(methylthio)propanoyl-CoA dehydrogenase
MGYVEETGAAQILRDARITTIYEGTTGIQANDLVRRKIIGDGGKAARALIEEMRAWLGAERRAGVLPEALGTGFGRGLDAVEQAVRFVLERHDEDDALAGAAAVNLLMLMGTVLGGWQMGRAAEEAARQLAAGATGEERAFLEGRKVTARFYAEHILTRAHAYLGAVLAGSASIMSLDESLF